jgi:lipooligosaccharide transport system permease protein
MAFGVYTFWRRNLLVWRRSWLAACFAFILDPMVFLFAFGYGLGAAFDQMAGLPYFAFVVPGMMGLGLLYTSFVEGSYVAYNRFVLQGTYHAVLATPMTLGHIVAAELLWAGTKATLSAACILAVGAIFGGVLSGAFSLLALPVAFLTAMAVAAMSLTLMAFCRTMDDFNFAWPLIVTPMLLFGGTFIAIEQFPHWVQWVGKVLPLYHGVEVMRALTSGREMAADVMAAHLAYLLAFVAVFGTLAWARLHRRIYQ